jgi:excisionase family DNA binding protein
MAPLMTVADVAAFLQMEPKTVYKYVKAGILHAHQIGGRLRFTRDDIARFVNAHARSWEFGAPLGQRELDG